jgi:hypothetical protein
MPTPGLISLFNKTGGRRLNPKLPNLSHQRHRRAYANIVLGSMEQGGMPANNSRPGFGQHGYQSGAPRGAGQAEAFHGDFNKSYHGFGGGSYGRRGGPNIFQHRGRGYGGRPMSQRGGFEGYRRPQVSAAPSQHPQITMSGRAENPNAQALNQYAKAHQAGTDSAVGFPNPTTQGHLSTSARDGQEKQATQSSVIDISGLSSSAAGLLKQLLASMGGKKVIKDEAQVVESAPVKEKECAVLPEKGTELA